MTDARRLLWGAPGPLLAGFPASDDDRSLLMEACQRITEHWKSAYLDELLVDLRTLYPEIARMVVEMGSERMVLDARLVELKRAGSHAAWILQLQTAYLQAFFAPTDPEAEAFRPAAALSLTTSSWQRRVTRLDSLRQAYVRHPGIPDAEARAAELGKASARLFHAVTEAREGAQEPVPLAEARQRWDRSYASLRDAVIARRALDADTLTTLFKDVSPVWRFARLALQP